MLDLHGASRDELIRIILVQRETLADLDRQLGARAAELAHLRAVIAQLTERLGALEQAAREDPPASPSDSRRGMLGLNGTEAPERARWPRKRRDQGYGRRRMTATA